MTTRVEPTTTFADSTAAILDYLVQRTADTAGKVVARSDAVVVGEVEKSEARDGFEVRTRLRVEQWLTGSGAPVLDVVHDARAVPPFSLRDRALLFLRKASDAYDVVASRKPDPELLDAVRWYAALPADDERREAALIGALPDHRPRVVHHAVRELAEERGAGAAPHLQNALRSARGESRTILILGLWIAGQKDAAIEGLERELGGDRDAWLERWGVRASLTDRGERTGTLFGPAGGNPWSIE